MTIGTNSYGNTTTIAVLTPRWGNSSGVFDTTTQPTLTQCEGFCDQVSGLLNSILAQNGFKIPVTQADCVLVLAMFVNEEVAAIIEGLHGSGRFGPTTKQPGKGRFALVMDDVQTFITTQADGFERLGATRTYDWADSIGFRGQDQSGADTFPIFQRKSFGETFADMDT